MKRKKIRWVAISVVVVLILGISASFFNEEVNVERGFQMDKTLSVSEDLQKILYYGTLAPNSHNAQMWKVKVLQDGASEKSVRIMVDDTRSLKQVDPSDRESYISLGAFLENMAQAAKGLGWNADVEAFSQKAADGGIADVQMKKSNGELSTDSLKLVENRCTYRGLFQKDSLSQSDEQSLQKAGDGSTVYYPLSSTTGSWIANGLIAANVQQADNDAKQQEFADHVRFTKQQAQQKKDGITPQMMGLTGIRLWYVSNFMNQNSVMSQSFRSSTGDTVRGQVQNCSGFLAVTGGNSLPELIQTGRVLERVWIAAESQKIAVHPMSQLMEESPWNGQLSAKLGVKQPVQMILRIGYTKQQPAPDSLRRDLKEILA